MHIRLMRLDEYMTAKGLDDEDMAHKIGRDRSLVTKLRAGKVWPSRETALQIKAATEGAVLPDDFLPEQGAPVEAAP